MRWRPDTLMGEIYEIETCRENKDKCGRVLSLGRGMLIPAREMLCARKLIYFETTS